MIFIENWKMQFNNDYSTFFSFFFLSQDILSQRTVALHIEVNPRYLIPDTNCFVDDLISITAIANAHPLYQLMIPITGKVSTFFQLQTLLHNRPNPRIISSKYTRSWCDLYFSIYNCPFTNPPLLFFPPKGWRRDDCLYY